MNVHHLVTFGRVGGKARSPTIEVSSHTSCVRGRMKRDTASCPSATPFVHVPGQLDDRAGRSRVADTPIDTSASPRMGMVL